MTCQTYAHFKLGQILTVSPIPVVDYSVVPLEMIRQNVIMMEKMACDACPTYDTKEFDVNIPMRDGYETTMRVIKPSAATSSGGSPLIALFHGGAFSMGTNMQLVPWARAIANLHGAVTVSLEYRLAPEHKFPQAAHDAWDGVQWLAANAPSVLGADLSRGFVLGGVSSGANLTLVTAQRALKENLSPPITGAFATMPLMLNEKTVPEKYKDLWISRDQNANAPVVNENEVRQYDIWYGQDYFSEDYSPTNSNIGFSGHPPTYIQVSGMDPLRDDGMVYARVLGDDGVKVNLDAYPGVPHGHVILWPHVKKSIKTMVDLLSHIGQLLGKNVDREVVEKLWKAQVGV
jgi:acetyl esterase/lipase